MSTLLELTDNNFDSEVKKATTPMLVDFWAPWCGPCRAVAPLLEELAAEYKGRVVVAKINVDENQSIPAKFGVRSIPSILVLKDGEEINRIVGARPKNDFKAILDPLV